VYIFYKILSIKKKTVVCQNQSSANINLRYRQK